METWTRADGRFYCIDLTNDLFGPAVVIWHGGARGGARVRTVPLNPDESGGEIISRLEKRRLAHGYVLESPIGRVLDTLRASPGR